MGADPDMQREHPVMMETEAGVMHLPEQGTPGLPAATRSREGPGGILPGAWRESAALLRHLQLRLLASEPGENSVLLL